MQRFMVALFGVAVLALPAAAQLSRVEADPNKTYEVNPEVGPWMVCVTYYTGEQSRKLANELALEIRRRDNLPAFIFDRGEEQRRKHLEEKARLKEMYPDADLKRVRTTRMSDECVVLIGGYKDMETARRELERIKKLKPPQSEKLMSYLVEVQPVNSGGAKPRGEIKGAQVNPFPNSFVARNPTAAPEKPAATSGDQFLKQLNANEEYSLLKCRQPYTLVVASFQGASVIQSASTGGSFMDRLLNTSQGKSLAASGQNAHNLAKVLRELKFDETYVLHRRQDSLVTVGGFRSLEDPNIRLMQQALATRLRPSSGVKLLSQPFPMEVPRP